MIDTRSRLVVVLAAAALALSACTSAAERGSTGTQNGNPTGAQATTPAATQRTAPTASASPDVGAGQEAMEAEQEAMKDVKLGALRVDTKGTRSAEVAITNNSSKRSNYIVDLQLMSADGKTQLDTAMVSAVGLASGKTTKVTAQFASTEKLPKGAKISIAGVARLAA